jgi:hypothetical protein
MVKQGPDTHWYLHTEISRALRLLLKNWILTNQALGNRRLLRRIKTGIETGGKRPQGLKREAFLEEIRRLRQKGEEDSAEAITGRGKTITEILTLRRLVFDPDGYSPRAKTSLKRDPGGRFFTF